MYKLLYKSEQFPVTKRPSTVMPEPGGPGGPLAPPIFCISVNPISTGEGRLSPPITTGTPNVFHLPAALSTVQLTSIKVSRQSRIVLQKNATCLLFLLASNCCQSTYPSRRQCDSLDHEINSLKKQARKGFLPLSAMQEIGYFQNLKNFFGIFFEIFQIFLEDFFWRIFLIKLLKSAKLFEY